MAYNPTGQADAKENPAGKGGVAEIEVTPEMIEAGRINHWARFGLTNEQVEAGADEIWRGRGVYDEWYLAALVYSRMASLKPDTAHEDRSQSLLDQKQA